MERLEDDRLPPEPAGAGAADDAAGDPPPHGDASAEPGRDAPPAGHDPDAEELEFLERSLDDLDAERSAGDISEGDYRSLSTLYTERVAAVRRRGAAGGFDSGRTGAGPAGRASRNWRRVVAVLVIVAMVGTGLGVGLASALGSRSSLDTATGDIRQSSRGQLFEAQEHMAAGRFAEAEQIYAEVVAAQPSSAEALAWWGWLDFLRGDLESAAERLETAVAVDPRYPDARVFGAVVAIRLGRLEAAAAHLDVFDGLDPAPIMVELVASYELRERILAGRLAAAEQAGDVGRHRQRSWPAPRPARWPSRPACWPTAGRWCWPPGCSAAPWRPTPPTSRRWWAAARLLTRPDFAAFEDLLAEGLRALDRAVELSPDSPEARFWRGLALANVWGSSTTPSPTSTTWPHCRPRPACWPRAPASPSRSARPTQRVRSAV